MKLIIEDDEGRKTVVPLVQEEMEITIGRQEDNVIRLTERNVSRKHARLARRQSEFIIEDLGSYCGVKVNGQRVQGSHKIAPGDVIQIGDYDIGLQGEKKEERNNASQKTAASAPNALSLSKVPSQRLSTSIISIDNPAEYDDVPVVDIPIEEAPRIVVQSGEFKGREFACIRSVLTVGRDFENDIAIDHRSLSRNHCKFIRTQNDEWKVVDLDSSNGVQVNGERYSVGTLASGDTILIGRIKLSFLIPGGESGTHQSHRSNGEAARHSTDSRNADSSRPITMIVGVAAVLALMGVGGVFFLKNKSTEPTVLAVALDLQDTKEDDSPPAQIPEKPEADAAAIEAFGAGKALLEAEKFSEAAEFLQKAADAGIEGADTLLEKAVQETSAFNALKASRVLVEEKNFEEALAHLEEIPESSSQAEAAQALLKKIEAAKAEEEARQREEERKAELVAQAQAKKQAAASKAKHPYGSAFEEIPEEKMKVLDGYLGEMCDNPHKAIPPLKKLIKENSNYGYAYVFLGSCYIEIQETEAGEDLYRTFLRRWPKHPDAQMVKDALSH